MPSVVIGKIRITHQGEWQEATAYEPLCIVTKNGNASISKKQVPVGIAFENTEYWGSIYDSSKLRITVNDVEVTSEQYLSGALEDINTRISSVAQSATIVRTHSKSGTTHTLVGAGNNELICFKATADYAVGDKFSVGSETLNAVDMQNKALPANVFKTGDLVYALKTDGKLWLTCVSTGIRLSVQEAQPTSPRINDLWIW